MRLLSGKVKIGSYRGIEILVDWGYLMKDRGLKKEEESFEKVLGRFLRIISIFGFSAVFIYLFTLGNFLLTEMVVADSLVAIVAWILIGLFLYSVYLSRDRNEFVDTLDLKALEEFRKKLERGERPEQIEVLDFVDHNILNIFDDLIGNNKENIYTDLMSSLVQLDVVKKLFERLGVDQQKFVQKIANYQVESEGDKSFQINKLLFQSFVLAEKYGYSYIGAWVVFLKLALDEYSRVFRELDVQQPELLAVLEWSKTQAIINRYKKMWKFRASLKPKNTVNRSYTSVYTSKLNDYSRDLTLQMTTENFIYAISREQEIADIIRYLRQQGSSAVLLLGEAGVGKSTILKSLAVRMVVEDVPKELQDKRLVEFDFQRAVSASKNTNELRKLFEEIFSEVEKARNVILVIDDLDELVNIREEIAGEIITTIVKSLEQNKIRLIATSSRMGYSRSIKPNSALSALFDIVEINEPDAEIALQVLCDERDRLERQYGVKIQFEAMETAVELSIKYDTTRLLPYKAIDALEDASVLSKDNGIKFVSSKEVEKVISRDAGIKVGGVSGEESERLMRLENEMHKRVVGQEKAIEAVAAALRRARAGLAGFSRPVASFLFFGPTGVGKTEVARTLAAVYFGDEKLVTRLDMSEFQEGENVKRLIGYQQGDDFIGGQLTEKVRSNPFSLVLLDEIEKANPQVLDLFLQVLDEGHITDGIGRKVDFRNTIIIATSNIGSSQIARSIEAGMSYEDTYRTAQEELRKTLRLEFLNRFDKVIMFKPLNLVEIEKVADLMLKKLARRLADQGIKFEYSGTLLRELAQKGYSPVFGARELNRVIQEQIENKIADMIVSGKTKSGSVVKMDSLT